MKINLEPKFSVFNNKVVKCELECEVLVPCYCSDYHTRSKLEFDYTIRPYDKNYDWEFIGFKVDAIAKCDPTDTFDEVVGKRIAESRATIKALNAAGRLLEVVFVEKVLKVNDFIADADEKIGRIFEKELKHLDTLLGKDE